MTAVRCPIRNNSVPWFLYGKSVQSVYSINVVCVKKPLCHFHVTCQTEKNVLCKLKQNDVFFSE